MADAMMFPDTFEEFVKWYGFVDSGEHYTNGSELIQVFRVKQWLEHEFNRIEEEKAKISASMKKYRDNERIQKGYCDNGKRKPDDFCSYGERKCEDGENNNSE